MIEKESMDRMPEKGKKLSRYLNNKESYEIMLLDMLRANEIPQAEYDSIIKEEEQSYAQFLEDLKEDNANVKYV